MPEISNLPQINHPVAAMTAMTANQLSREHTKANESKKLNKLKEKREIKTNNNSKK